MTEIFKLSHLYPIISTISILLCLALLVYFLQALLNIIIKKILLRYRNENLLLISKSIKIPIIFLSLLFIFYLSFSFLKMPLIIDNLVSHLLILSTIFLVSWLLIRGVAIIRNITLRHYDITLADNLVARKVHTQLKVVERIVNIIIIIITFAAVLMTFEPIRQVGVSILASAGLFTAIIGFAAQKSLGSILAGIQVAITQPIRIDDVVIVENEWGVIEEINLSYVVMRIWDKRRLIIPVNYFLETPFQNWSHTSTDLLGTVFIYTDYNVPVAELNSELSRIVKDSPLWDGVASLVQMTDAKPNVVELRVMVSALNASDLFSLRCLVREKLIDYIATHYPNSLPKTRLDFKPENIFTDNFKNT